MNIGFDNILQHAIPMEDFDLKWRFTEKQYDKLPKHHLDQLKPLDGEASQFLWDYIREANLHNDMPFTENFFDTITITKILDENEVKTWLSQIGFTFDKLVFLSWDSSVAMIVPWKFLVQYFDSFYYRSSDDLTVIDQSLDWALLFFHADEIYFGAKKGFKPVNS